MGRQLPRRLRLSVGFADAEWLRQETTQLSPSLRASVVAPVERATAWRIRSLVIRDPFIFGRTAIRPAPQRASVALHPRQSHQRPPRAPARPRLPRSTHYLTSPEKSVPRAHPRGSAVDLGVSRGCPRTVASRAHACRRRPPWPTVALVMRPDCPSYGVVRHSRMDMSTRVCPGQ